VTLLDSPPVQQTGIETPQTQSPAPRIVAGSALVVIGVLWLLEQTGLVDFTVTAVLALGTGVVGVGLMLLAGRGPHRGLIVFGTVLALITTITASAPLEGFQGGVGERIIEVNAAEDIRPNYNLAMGTLTLDLRDLTGLETSTAVTASVGLGELVIRVPADTAVDVRARAGAGEVAIFGRTVDGMGIDETYQTPGLVEGAEILVIKAEVFMGTVEVTN
jgi:hypothetical protein